MRLLALAALVLAGPASVAYRSYRAERSGWTNQRHPVDAADAKRRLPGVTAVAIRGADRTALRGWYVPSRNRAAIVLLHGSGDDRSSLIAEAELLGNDGFGILMFDWPGHGESDGRIDFGEGARAALGRALDWMSGREDVDAAKIGAFGFSVGGCVLARVAVEQPRLKALVLAGTPATLRESIEWQYRRYGRWSQGPALLALRSSGVPVHELRPIEDIAKVAPRPVFIVSGNDDTMVTPPMVRRLHAAAREPKSLWFIDGAKHGAYARAAPEEYGRRLRGFFEASLLV